MLNKTDRILRSSGVKEIKLSYKYILTKAEFENSRFSIASAAMFLGRK